MKTPAPARGYARGIPELTELTHAVGIILGESARCKAAGKKPGILSWLRFAWRARSFLSAAADGVSAIPAELADMNEDEARQWLGHVQRAAPSIFPSDARGQVIAEETRAVTLRALQALRKIQNTGTESPAAAPVPE